jgi:hypothetical protein
MTGVKVVRGIIGTIGVLMFVAGLAVATLGGTAFFVALWLLVSGGVLIIVAVIEIGRYRSEAAEQAHAAPGPGGGETGALEPRFRPTDEIFVDPTSRQRMRVYSDSRTGERRYVAED